MKRSVTPLKAIRLKCLDCSCGQAKEVKLCPIDDCPLYEFRMGRRLKKDEVLKEEDIAED